MVLKGLGMGFLALSTSISIEIQTKKCSISAVNVNCFFFPTMLFSNQLEDSVTLPHFKHYILNIFFRCYKLCCSSPALQRGGWRERCKNEERVAKVKCKLG